jgi:mRNA-degrading endonuclease toxin of MazEF toxin-antitoxin module
MPVHVPAALAPGRAHDYDGPVTLAYAPRHDGEPDPGEVVWTWVPYEEDASLGKDRPVVVMGRPTAGRAGELAVLMLSTKDHHDDPRWTVLGRGGWDPQGRVSSVRLDRVLAVSPSAVRREGAALERDRFDHVAAALRTVHGWT